MELFAEATRLQRMAKRWSGSQIPWLYLVYPEERDVI